ncbi:hypothetical protein B0H14DRAFT_3533994 [Mycena olivaceomarginata]|nr:hypothetical protein B0H14DRAFT_3533994 [Mycena olivaceomarginata]
MSSAALAHAAQYLRQARALHPRLLSVPMVVPFQLDTSYSPRLRLGTPAPSSLAASSPPEPPRTACEHDGCGPAFAYACTSVSSFTASTSANADTSSSKTTKAGSQRSGMSTGHEGAATAGYNVDADMDEPPSRREARAQYSVDGADALDPHRLPRIQASSTTWKPLSQLSTALALHLSLTLTRFHPPSAPPNALAMPPRMPAQTRRLARIGGNSNSNHVRSGGRGDSSCPSDL